MSLQSSGTVNLRSKDPSDPPFVDPKFLEDAFDKRVAIEAVREAFKFLNSPSLSRDHVRFAAEPDSMSDKDVLVCSGCCTFNTMSHPRLASRSLLSSDTLTFVSYHRLSLAKQRPACGICVARWPWANGGRPIRVLTRSSAS